MASPIGNAKPSFIAITRITVKMTQIANFKIKLEFIILIFIKKVTPNQAPCPFGISLI